MEAETVNKVAKLYKDKSELLEELSNLTDGEGKSFSICYRHKGLFTSCSGGSYLSYNRLSKSFLAEIKELTVKHIKEQINNIDKELEQL